MSSPYRLVFLMQQVLGHVTYSDGLRQAVARDADVDATWVPITYWRAGGAFERLPLLPHGAKGVLRAASEVRRALSAGGIDGIFFNSPAIATSAARWIRRIPTTIALDVTPRQFDREAVHFNHRADGGGPVSLWKHRWNRGVLSRCAALAPWSSWTRDSLEHDYAISPASMTVIPPGVDIEAWSPQPRPRSEMPRILFVGGDFHRKGGDVLLQWFRERGRGRCEMHIVSADPVTEGADAPDIHVHRGLRPNDADLRELYWSSDVFVLPSRSEPFGIACVEALAAGLPVVASHVGGLTDIVDDGVDGLLVPPGDVRQLGAAIESLLESPRRRREMGEHGLRVAGARFDGSRNYRRVLDVVKATVDQRRRPVAPAATEASVR